MTISVPQFIQFSNATEALAELSRLSEHGRIDWCQPVGDALQAAGLFEEFGAHDQCETWHKWAQLPWYGPLEPYLHPVPGAPFVSDVLVNGPGDPISIVEQGRYSNTGSIPHPSWIIFLQRQLALQSKLVAPDAPDAWPSRKGAAQASLLIGSVAGRIRFSITRAPLTPIGPTVAIRILPKNWPTLDDLVKQEALAPEARDLLLHAAQRGVSILVAGGTGSGKTTLTAALLQALGATQRVVLIEEACELPRLRDSLHMEVLQSEWSFSDCVRAALRKKPDRIVVGEVRGPEALAMLQAAATGHPGLGTIHAPDPAAALSNLERMACESGEAPPDVVRRMLGSKAAPLLVAHIGRYGEKRRVGRIDEVLPQAAAQAGAGFALNTLFEFRPDIRQYLRRPVTGEWGEQRF